jgi:phage tail-like protein
MSRGGWLVEQLPRPLAEDGFASRLVGMLEEVADSVRGRIDGIEHCLDPGLAPVELVRWMGGWLGLALEPTLPEERQRDVLAAAGALLAWRGTRRGLEGLLEAFTAAPVQVHDNGGVFPRGSAPPVDRRVTVRLESTGGLDEQQLLELIRAEVPADAEVELLVQGRRVEAPGRVGDDDASWPDPGSSG